MTSERISRVWGTILLTITICLVRVSAQAGTSRYIFLSEQSTLIQTGGIAGIHRTYTITGTFQLTADFEAGTALFVQVDASAVCSIPSRTGRTEHYSLDPNEVFNMKSLAGVIVDGDESIRFDGITDDGSSIQITLKLADGSVSLKGETVPPPDSTDFFIYTVDALAEPKYEYSSGSGTADDPYRIYTAADLIGLGKNPEDYDKHFILVADIDLDPNLPGRKVFDKAVIASASPTNEYPYVEGTSFTGVFDGNGHMISHLTIAGGSYLGLFWRLGSGAIISNLYLEAVDVNGTGNYVGGLAGWNDGSIATSHSTGTVSGKGSVGGLVGDNSTSGSITTSYSTAKVIGSARNGGLVGCNSGSITASYSTGTVTGDWFIGGLVGNNVGGGELGNGIITASYSTGAVSGGIDVGGLVGYNFWANVIQCYSTGSVSGSGSSVGGMAGGNNGGSIETSFWDMQRSGQATSDGGTGKTTAEMQTASTFLEARWDLINVWGIGENQTYPYLRKHSAADINQDGIVNFLDLCIIAEQWMEGQQ